MTTAPLDTIYSAEFQSNNRALDFLSVRRACPKGIYLTAPPDDSTQWEGVLFAREGPYSPAVFRFQIAFPEQYPQKLPVVIFTSDVFHPLVSPLTTYTYSNQDPEAETVSASDQYRLPPGAFSLRHGFPECFTKAPTRQSALGSVIANTGMSPLSKAEFIPGIGLGVDANNEPPATSPHIAVILYYLRAAFTREDVLDSVSQEAAANPAAWHAWRTSRAKTDSRNNSVRSKSEAGLNTVENLRQQPGGARSPGEWNWDGVWEDRVRKSIQNSMSEQAMFKRPGLSEDSIQFIDVDDETIGKAVPWTPHINQTPIFNTSDTP